MDSSSNAEIQLTPVVVEVDLVDKSAEVFDWNVEACALTNLTVDGTWL